MRADRSPQPKFQESIPDYFDALESRVPKRLMRPPLLIGATWSACVRAVRERNPTKVDLPASFAATEAGGMREGTMMLLLIQ